MTLLITALGRNDKLMKLLLTMLSFMEGWEVIVHDGILCSTASSNRPCSPDRHSESANLHLKHHLLFHISAFYPTGMLLFVLAVTFLQVEVMLAPPDGRHRASWF